MNKIIRELKLSNSQNFCKQQEVMTTTRAQVLAIFLFPSLMESKDMVESFQPNNLINNSKPHEIIVLTSAILSILGCLSIILSYFLWKEVQTPSRRILMFISIADLLSTSSNIWGIAKPNGSQTACIVEAAVNAFANVSSFLWTVTLALYLYLALVKDDIDRGNWLIYRVFSPLCWGIPLVITIIGCATDRLGSDHDYLTSGWCWVAVKDAQQVQDIEIVWMFIAGKGWEILAYFTIAGLYIIIVCTIKREVSSRTMRLRMPGEIEAMKKVTMKMMLIPVVFIVLRIWGTIRFGWILLSNQTEQQEKYKTLAVALIFLQGVGDTSQGWANCLLFFCFTKKVRSKLKEFFKVKCFGFPCKGIPEKKPRHSLNERSADFHKNLFRTNNDNSALLRSQSLDA